MGFQKDDAIAEVIMNMHREGDSLEKIARIVGKNAEEVQAIIERKEPVMA